MGNSLNVGYVQNDAMKVIEDSIPEHFFSLKYNNLTVEEFFYAAKALRWSAPLDHPHRNQFMIGIKGRIIGWLDDQRPKPFIPWERLAFYWQKDFFRFLETGEI